MQFIVRARARVTFVVDAHNQEDAEEAVKEILSPNSNPLRIVGDAVEQGQISDFKAVNVTPG